MGFRRILLFLWPLWLLAAPLHASEVGFLQVNVSVEAEVYVNGNHMGQTGPGRALNIKRGFPVGSVTVRVEAEGLPPVEKNYRISANQWTQAIFDLRDQKPSAPASPPPETFTEPRRPAYSPPSRETDVAILLRTCHRHFDKNRLTTPAGSNANECYRDVLARDPGNESALKGLRAIERKYGRWAENAIDEGDLDKARVYLSRLESAMPDSPGVPRLRAAIAEAERTAVARSTPIPNIPQARQPDSPVRIEVSKAPEPPLRPQQPSAAATAPVWQPAAPQPQTPAPASQAAPTQPRSGVTWQNPDAAPTRQVAPDTARSTSASAWQSPDTRAATAPAPGAGGASGSTWQNPDRAARPATGQPSRPVSAADFSTIEMIRIPGGCYTMGSPEQEPGRSPNERQHRACVEDFDIGKNEVKVVDFLLFTRETGYQTDAERNTPPGQGCFSQDASGNHSYVAGRTWRNPGYPQQDDHPVVCVSWRDAVNYVEWLNSKTGQSFRLPTEAEWEFAARAGSLSATPWEGMSWTACQHGDIADTQARSKYPTLEVFQCDDGYANTAPVGRFKPNVYGLHDMMANVSEWTCSAYSESYRGPENNCAAMGDGGLRVHRGASWHTPPARTRYAARFGQHSSARFDSIGFRLARGIKE